MPAGQGKGAAPVVTGHASRYERKWSTKPESGDESTAGRERSGRNTRAGQKSRATARVQERDATHGTGRRISGVGFSRCAKSAGSGARLMAPSWSRKRKAVWRRVRSESCIKTPTIPGKAVQAPARQAGRRQKNAGVVQAARQGKRRAFRGPCARRWEKGGWIPTAGFSAAPRRESRVSSRCT